MPRNAALAALCLLALVACDKPQPPPAAPTTPVVLRTNAAPPAAVVTPPAALEPAATTAAATTNAPTHQRTTEPIPRILTTNIIAFVGDEAVTVDEFTKAFPAGTLDAMPDYLRRQYAQFIEQMIANHVLGVAADHEVFTNEPGYQRDIDAAVRQVNMQYFFNRYIQSRVTITDADVRAYYESNAAEYTVPQSIHVWHILIATKKGAFPAEVSNAFEKARGIRARLMEGESFAAIAAAESDDPSKGKGGDLGFRQPGQLLPALDKAAFALRNNEVSGVIKSEYGFNIVQVTDRLPGRRRTLDEVKDQIRDVLAQQREQQLYADLFAALTNTYQVLRNETLIQDLVHSGL
jgi:hypothetical protein